MPPPLIRILLLLLLVKLTVNTSAQPIHQTIEQKINAEDAARKASLQTMHTFTETHRTNTVVTVSDLFIKGNTWERPTTTPCVDSSFRKVFEITADRNHSFYCSAKTSDGGILIGGFGRDRSLVPLGPWCGVITKFDSIGNHLWSRQVASDVYSSMNITAIKELSDGTIIAAGTHDNSLYHVPPQEYQDFFVSKLSSTGDLIWFKTFHSPLVVNCSSGNIYEAFINEGLNGDLLIGGTIWNCPYPKYLLAFKLNSSGTLQWSKAFRDPSNDAFCGGIYYEAGIVKLINRASNVFSGGNNVIHVDLLKLDYSNGSLISYNSWKVDLPFPASFDFGFTNSLRSVKLANGNLCVYGQTFGDYATNPTTSTPRYNVIEFDPNDNFVSAYTIRSQQQGNPSVDRIKVDKNKRALYSFYQGPIYLGSVADGKILNQRRKDYTGYETFWHNFEIFDDGSYVLINNISSPGQSNFFLDYALLHNSDTGSVCLGSKEDFSNIASSQYVPYNFNWSQIINDPIIVTNNQNNSSIPLSYIYAAPCIQTASCDTPKIHGITTACDYQQDFIFTCYRDYRCGTRVNWSIEPSVVQTFQILDDTTLKLRLNQPWQGWLYAEINTTCGLLKDSVFLTITTSPGPVNLGPDLQLCPSNTIVLNAHSGYATYLWNNGSTDSMITINTAGQYYVDVTDGCNNSFSDTIIVTNAASIPLDIGSDRMKCNNDTLHLNAPGGFIGYTWGPNYNISSLTAQNVVVQPAVDTIYFLKAEKTLGCFAFDTIRIKVKHSVPINLGPDKSFCNGDSAVLNAAPGFNQYFWNNGSSNMQLVVHSTGTYSVIGTDMNGCRSYDTLKILNVWSNPIVILNKDTSLCSGGTRVLQPGSFNSYLWQNGSTMPTYTISGAGIYYVTVADNNFCKGSDTVRITTVWPVPTGFLPGTASICNYGTSMLRSLNNFKSYWWNTGSHASSITISQPGIYWLQVTDNNQCTGTDSIIITLKECLKGFYIPTGFTPDNNGRNDYFKPIIGGNLQQYQFTIYNRWGQVVFTTKELNKGWDGKFTGIPQDGNVFVWACLYQLEGEVAKFKKGTFVLIR